MKTKTSRGVCFLVKCRKYSSYSRRTVFVSGPFVRTPICECLEDTAAATMFLVSGTTAVHTAVRSVLPSSHRISTGSPDTHNNTCRYVAPRRILGAALLFRQLNIHLPRNVAYIDYIYAQHAPKACCGTCPTHLAAGDFFCCGAFCSVGEKS